MDQVSPQGYACLKSSVFACACVFRSLSREEKPHTKLWCLVLWATSSWRCTAGSAHALLMRSSNVTSTFSTLYLFNLWHYGELLPAVAVPANRKPMFSFSPSAQSACFPPTLKKGIPATIWCLFVRTHCLTNSPHAATFKRQ